MSTVAPAVISATALSQSAKSQFELEKVIMDALQDLIGETVDPAKPLAGQGLDSLAAMELRQKLEVCSSCILCVTTKVNT